MDPYDAVITAFGGLALLGAAAIAYFAHRRGGE